MFVELKKHWRRLKATGERTVAVLVRFGRHEWRGLLGNQRELAERLQLARQARGLGELINAQLDLVPESRRRWQRNAATRRALLAELGAVLSAGTTGREAA